MRVAVPLLAVLLAAHSPFLATADEFETTTVDGELAITSEWEGGFCGSLLTRNPGTNPSTSWAGLFTFTGGELTTGPNGNGVGERLGPTQWSFVPTDPAQMAIFPNSSVVAHFCCNAANNAQVQASFRVIFSYDYKGVGYSPPSPPSPPPPAPSPPPPSPPSPSPPSPPPPRPVRSPPPPVVAAPVGGPQPAPALAPAAAEDLQSGAPEPGTVPATAAAPAPAPKGSRKLK